MQPDNAQSQTKQPARGNMSAPSETEDSQRLGATGEGGGIEADTNGPTSTAGAPGHVIDNVGGPGLGEPPRPTSDKRSQ